MSRLTIVDGFRGFFLLFMAQHHFNDLLATRVGKLNHEYFGWVDVSQGFVFISGLVVGLVYGRSYLRAPSECQAKVLGRARTIYLHQAGLILILFAAATLLGPMASPDLQPYVKEPAGFLTATLMLLTASTHMGILPMYMFFLLLTPLAFRLLARGWDVPFFLLLVLAWALGQTGLVELAADRLQVVLGTGFGFGFGFNSFAWQLLFFTGLWFGFRAAAGRLDLAALGQEQYRAAFLICLVAILALGIFDRIVGWDLLGSDYAAAVKARTDVGFIAWIYPIAFAIDLFVVVWLVRVGVSDRARWVRWMGAAVHWIFTRKLLVYLGRHSLHVFSFHILVYYLIGQLVPPLGLGELGRSVVLLLGMASLYLAAWGHAWLQGRDDSRTRPGGRTPTPTSA